MTMPTIGISGYSNLALGSLVAFALLVKAPFPLVLLLLLLLPALLTTAVCAIGERIRLIGTSVLVESSGISTFTI